LFFHRHRLRKQAVCDLLVLLPFPPILIELVRRNAKHPQQQYKQSCPQDSSALHTRLLLLLNAISTEIGVVVIVVQTVPFVKNVKKKEQLGYGEPFGIKF
jgi:hypothetical protein